MKIVFFNAYYEPEVFASLYQCKSLCEDLVDNGFEVDLYTPVPTRGISNKVRKEYKKKYRHEIKKDGNFNIYRIYIPGEGKSTIFRAIRYIWMDIVFLYFGIKLESDVIFLYSTPPTQGVLGAIIKKIKKVPIIYNLHDVFPDSLVSSGLTHKDSVIFRLGKLIEKVTYKNADKIIVISEDLKRNILAKGVPEGKIEVVYNWVDENNIVSIDRHKNILIERFNLSEDKFYVVYAGNLGYAQNIEIILEAAKILAENKDIQFIIFGNGVQEKVFKNMVKELKLNNTKIFPLQPYSDVSYVYNLGDVSLVSCKPGYGNSAMPSKTWSIMSAGRPVIASFDTNTDLQYLIEDNKVGIFTKAGDAEELSFAISYLFENRNECILMGQNAKKFILNNLTRQIGTGRIFSIIISVLRND